MKLNKFLAFLILAGLSTQTWAYKKLDMNIFNECENNVKFVGIKADCNDLFHHYPANPGKKNPLNNTDGVKIAGYNIWNLGSSQTFYKDIGLTAQMLTQWDIIGAVEVLPTLADDASTNKNLLKAIKKGHLSINDPEVRNSYRKPGYLKLLLELRQIRPNEAWSLIISPYSQSKTNELVAYFYRGTKVKAISTPYCQHPLSDLKKKGALKGKFKAKMTSPKLRKANIPKEALGCILPVGSEKIEKRISRIPFLASFKSGNFDFSLLAAHLRFRAAGTVFQECGTNCRGIQKAMIDEAFDPSTKKVPALKAKTIKNLIDGKSVDDTYEEEVMDITMKLARAAFKKIPLKKDTKRNEKDLTDEFAAEFFKHIIKMIGTETKRNVVEEKLITLLKDIADLGEKEIKALKKMETVPISKVAFLIIDSDTLKKTITKASMLDKKLLKRRFSFIINKRKNPRYYETKMIMTSMNEIRNESGGDRDVIMVGDFNLELDDKMKGKVDYWKETLKAMPGATAHITEKTSVSPKKSKGGLANNYDHFLLDLSKTSECETSSGKTDARAFNFESVDNFKNAGLDTQRLERYLAKDQTLVTELEKKLKLKRTVLKNKIVGIKESKIKKRIKNFKRQLFASQEKDKSYYEVYKQIFSDHIPVHMTCTTNGHDDD